MSGETPSRGRLASDVGGLLEMMAIRSALQQAPVLPEHTPSAPSLPPAAPPEPEGATSPLDRWTVSHVAEEAAQGAPAPLEPVWPYLEGGERAATLEGDIDVAEPEEVSALPVESAGVPEPEVEVGVEEPDVIEGEIIAASGSGVGAVEAPEAGSGSELAEALKAASQPDLTLPSSSLEAAELSEPEYIAELDAGAPVQEAAEAAPAAVSDSPSSANVDEAAAADQPADDAPSAAAASVTAEPEAAQAEVASAEETATDASVEDQTLEQSPAPRLFAAIGNVKLEVLGGPRKGAKFLGKSRVASALGALCVMDRFDVPESTPIKMSLIAPRFADQIDIEDALVISASPTDERKIEVQLGFQERHDELEQFVSRYFAAKPGGGFSLFGRFRR